MNLPKELTARIADHLSNVRKNLSSLPPDERQEILQSIESHIYDALESRSDGEPTSALLEAVIAEMDPPESYGELPVVPKENRRWRTAAPLLVLVALVVIIYQQQKTPFEHNQKPDSQKGTTMKRPLTLAAVSILAATNLIAEEPRENFSPQEAINNASAGDTIIIPAGTYTQPVIIRKKITLDGQSVIFKVVANQPAIQIDTSEPVSLKNLEIQYQSKSKPQKGELPYAVYASGGDLLIEDCVFKGSGNSEVSPCAVLAAERSTLHIKNSRFDGFDYTVQLWNGSNGSIEDCLIMNPGHCGITIGDGSSATLKHNIVTGSRYHAIRCTGGKIIADSNLIADNKNRGFYIGNKSATGTLSNNLIVDNGIGINVFAESKLNIENNVILRSSYAGLSIADSAKLDMKDNVIIGNERGLVGFSSEQGREPSIELNGKNLVHGNTVESEKIELSSRTLKIDPLFSDPGTGLFTITEGDAKEMGLTDPTDMQVLWKKWQAAIRR
jgi:parallel beta-helix repeat protein